MDRAAQRTMTNTDLTEGMPEVGVGHSPANANPVSTARDTTSQVRSTVNNARGNTGIGDGLESNIHQHRLGGDASTVSSHQDAQRHAGTSNLASAATRTVPATSTSTSGAARSTGAGISNTGITNTGIPTAGIPRSVNTGAGQVRDAAADAAGNIPRDHHGGMNPLKAFGSRGAVGSQFEPDGAVGQVPQKVGGPFDKDGVIGRQFTSEGVVGGAVDKVVGDKNPKDSLGRYDNQ